MEIINITLRQTQSWQEIYQITPEQYQDLIKKYIDATGDELNTSDMQRNVEVLYMNGYLTDEHEIKNPNADVDMETEVEDISTWEVGA